MEWLWCEESTLDMLTRWGICQDRLQDPERRRDALLDISDVICMPGKYKKKK